MSPWTSHDDGDVEKTLAVYGAKSHHVRTVRKAARDPWIANKSAHMGGAQFEPSWLVDRAIPLVERGVLGSQSRDTGDTG